MDLAPCGGCGRHVKVDAGACPFCDRRRSPGSAALHLMGGALTTLMLAACYGSPIVDPPNRDNDNDGVPAAWDCDDEDATISPEEDEICGDEVDNDCDEDVDEEDCVEAEDTDA